jgi:hypothetical protein
VFRVLSPVENVPTTCGVSVNHQLAKAIRRARLLDRLTERANIPRVAVALGAVPLVPSDTL